VGDKAPLVGRRTGLVPPTAELVERLYRLAAVGDIPWPGHGASTPMAFQESLWADVLVQFGIEDLRSGRPVGLLRAERANFFHGYAHLSMFVLPEFRMQGWPLEAAVLFGSYVFRRYNLEHLYAEAGDTELEQYGSGKGSLFEVEATFRDRLLVNGERENQYVLTFTRERAFTVGAALIERLARSPATASNGSLSQRF